MYHDKREREREREEKERKKTLKMSSRLYVPLPLQNYKIDKQKGNSPCHNQKKLTPRTKSFVIC
jgi:hypothetical protein